MNSSVQPGPVRNLQVLDSVAVEFERLAQEQKLDVSDLLWSAMRVYKLREIEKRVDLLRPERVEGEPVVTDEEIVEYVSQIRSEAYQARHR